ncbi:MULTISPECIES: DEAD/DEAH box helicase [unclassified Azospirillum]|uniref:DEAD/DEAH box helicase n=1 Tax=unclassified Azospirillum TaxID=2630922 RepID=UPI000B70EC59|nr:MULTISPECIES: DEAD/DEAH box helicase [unclassified Azospirillum]SNT03649.1 ATP-dependent RNA helicase RhlE [Azospirillum sp. RU38E]SNT19434.1 ATP-dependent RNA helicase RhlE [Azospirillum sp. RU37A]
MDDFSTLGLTAPLNAGLIAAGYSKPTPIQAAALPAALAGRDVLGLAQTGTGKTAAFALPVLQALANSGGRARPGAPRALVVVPTRELGIQVSAVFDLLGIQLDKNIAVVHGGVSINPQIRQLSAGIDILVATPGRLIDLMAQGKCRLDAVEYFVLDEADRMLDMGFLPAVKKIVAALPKKRQTMFFSATMPDQVSTLAAGLLREHVRVEVTPPSTTVERIAQSVIMLEPAQKAPTLVALLRDPAVKGAIIFTRTKHGANRLAAQLAGAGIEAAAYHANKSQNARERALNAFRDGETRALVATDIAARGIDVDGVTHVFNFDLPEVAEAYVHRIGRTGRAGREGRAVSLVTPGERPLLRAIEKLTRQTIAPDTMLPAAAAALPTPKPDRPAQPQRPRRPRPEGARPTQAKPAGNRGDAPRAARPAPRATEEAGGEKQGDPARRRRRHRGNGGGGGAGAKPAAASGAGNGNAQRGPRGPRPSAG